MSQLRVYVPAAAEPASREDSFRDPMVLPFRSFGRFALRFRRGSVMNPLIRARLLHENRCCPSCRHPVVEPLELNDGFAGRGNLPIPGTATLVGFHCHRCHREWPAAGTIAAED